MNKYLQHILILLSISLFLGCNQTTEITELSETDKAIIQADTVYLNGTIWIGEQEAPDAKVLAVKDGIITYVGNGSDVTVNAKESIDLNGKFLMHGFRDNHVHFMEGGAALAGIDLRDAKTPQEFSQRISDYAKKTPKGRWILTGNWDHQLWGGELPHKNWIDANTKNNPVYVIRLDGHMGLANSAALAIAGIDADTLTPDGGEIVRDANGEPTGILKGNALNLILKTIPAPADDELMEQFALAQEKALSLGLTKVHAVTAYPTETTMLKIFQMAKERDILKLRAYVSTPIEDWQSTQAEVERNGYGDAMLSWGGIKGFIDGSLGSRTAWFHQAYLDAPEHTGGAMNDMQEFEGWLREVNDAGLKPSIHAIGNKAIDTLITQYQNIAGDKLIEKRFRIEHFQHPSQDAIQLAAKHGLILSMHPYHAIDDGRWAEERVGPEVIETTYAFRSVLDAGGILSFGSDWPVAPLNPLDGVYAAVTRRTLDDKNPNGWIPQEKIAIEEALRAYTYSNAYADHEEDVAGTLAIGKRADLVMLSDDPRKVEPTDIRNITVLRTVIDGQTVYRSNSDKN